MLGTLQYNGLLVCIGPNTTHMGEIQPLYQALKSDWSDIGLRLIHHRYATLSGDEEITALRLKYGELWFSAQLGDSWEIAESNR